MPELTVRIKKKTDGDAALTCVRADGSVTWQRQEGQLGRFFPLHDLTHFAVESVLGFDAAFFGLIASGWDISDFSGTGLQARLPEQALFAELLVGFFDLEMRTGVCGDASEYADKTAAFFAERNLPATSFRISDDQLAAVRTRCGELFARWRAVPPGETLELRFQ